MSANKIADADVMTIRDCYASGEFTIRDLKTRYKVSHTTIHSIIHGFTYSHLPLVPVTFNVHRKVRRRGAGRPPKPVPTVRPVNPSTVPYEPRPASPSVTDTPRPDPGRYTGLRAKLAAANRRRLQS